MAEELTISDIALSCVTFSGRCEDDLIADYERRCRRLKIVPLYGQLKTALKSLFAAGKVRFKVVGDHKLLCKVA
jgi:hypothetical protein